MEEFKDNKKRVRDEVVDLPEVKRLKENLLDDDDEFCTGVGEEDLDSLLKSFEEEIITPSPPADGGEELGYLLEASDDELGLPPTSDQVDFDRVGSVSSDLGEGFWEVTSYDDDPFGFGFVDGNDGGGDIIEYEGLFDYSDMGVGSGGFGWRPETLPAK